MVYIVKGLVKDNRILFVKAENEDAVRVMFSLGKDLEIVGRLTNNEVSALDTSHFAVIEA